MSQDYGLKISLPGYSVESATPEQCAVHSSYDSMKVKLDPTNPQEGNILVTFTDNPGVGVYPITTIHHGYGYIPAYYFFFDVRSSNANTGVEVGSQFPVDESVNEFFQVIPDTENITFNFQVTNAFAIDTLAGNYYAFRYYIFANDGI